MAEELRVGGVVGGCWAFPERPPTRLDRAGLVVARLAAARGVLVRAVLRPREAVLREAVLALPAKPPGRPLTKQPLTAPRLGWGQPLLLRSQPVGCC